jgi:hypothetical protein
VARLDGTRRRRQGEKINITHRHFAADRQVLQERVAVAVGEVHSWGIDQEGEYLADRGSTKGSMLPLLVMKPYGGTSAEQELNLYSTPEALDSGKPLVRGTRRQSSATMVYWA